MHPTEAAAVDTTEAGEYALAMERREEMILIEQARDGCEQSFAALVTAESPRLIRLAWRLVGNRSDAEDIVQEAFLRLHRALPGFRGDSRLGTWLYRTVSRLAIDALRRETLKRRIFFLRRDNDDPDPLDQAPSPESGVDDRIAAREQLTRLQPALRRLSPRQRAVLTLRHQEELPLAEIATILDLSLGSVKVHLHRAVAALREAVEEEDVI